MNLRGAKPVKDFSIRERIEGMIPAQDLYNDRLPEEFKSEILTLPVRLLIKDWEKINKQIERLTSNN